MKNTAPHQAHALEWLVTVSDVLIVVSALVVIIAFLSCLSGCDAGERASGEVLPIETLDLSGDVIRHEYFDTDGHAATGPLGWHRIETLRDRRGLAIEQIGYDHDQEPVDSPHLGYAIKRMEYDEQGRQTRVAYFGADDRPTRVGPSDADTFLVVSEGGADYHAANTHYLSEGAVMHTYANERGEAMENSDGCGWTAKRALPAEGREIELCVSLDGLTYMTDDILTYADGSSRWLHCEVAGDVRCELLELDVHQHGDWRALEEDSDELAEVKREVLGIEDVSLDDASEYVPGC